MMWTRQSPVPAKISEKNEIKSSEQQQQQQRQLHQHQTPHNKGLPSCTQEGTKRNFVEDDETISPPPKTKGMRLALDNTTQNQNTIQNEMEDSPTPSNQNNQNSPQIVVFSDPDENNSHRRNSDQNEAEMNEATDDEIWKRTIKIKFLGNSISSRLYLDHARILRLLNSSPFQN